MVSSIGSQSGADADCMPLRPILLSHLSMSVYAACMLIPVGVMIYTLAGGLKATFIADYIHTVYIVGT